jgi:hypothetical protein
MVYDACQSGTFVNKFLLPAGSKRIIAASASADEDAIFASEGIFSFSWIFWSQIYAGQAFYEAFENSRKTMSLFTNQNPVIDADGNGIVNEKSDYEIAQNIRLGQKIKWGADFPTIGSVSPGQTIMNSTSALIWAENVLDANGIKKVWAVITPPNYNNYSANTPVISLPTVELRNVGNNRYEVIYDKFTAKGEYRIVIFAMDNRDLNSLPEQHHITYVTQTQGNNCLFISNDLALNVCADFHRTKYGLTLNYSPNEYDPNGLYWKMDINTFRVLQSDPGNCIGVNDDLTLNLCAEYQGHNYGFTMSYSSNNPNDPSGLLYWKMDVGTFREIR